MGVGIAISQPTFAALVGQWFPYSVARATGFWANGLLVGELLSASLTLPLVLPFVGNWEGTFAVWSGRSGSVPHYSQLVRRTCRVRHRPGVGVDFLIGATVACGSWASCSRPPV
jgi:hypothetical protein